APRASGLTTERQRASELRELANRHSTSKIRAGGSLASEFRAKHQLAARVDTTVERRDHHVCTMVSAPRRCFGWLLSPPPWSRASGGVSAQGRASPRSQQPASG